MPTHMYPSLTAGVLAGTAEAGRRRQRLAVASLQLLRQLTHSLGANHLTVQAQTVLTRVGMRHRVVLGVDGAVLVALQGHQRRWHLGCGNSADHRVTHSNPKFIGRQQELIDC